MDETKLKTLDKLAERKGYRIKAVETVITVERDTGCTSEYGVFRMTLSERFFGDTQAEAIGNVRRYLNSFKDKESK